MGADVPDRIRVDKWLWHARFFKSRGQAGEICGSGSVRINGERVLKPAHQLRTDDVLTFPKGPHIRVIKVLAISTRRGPAPEAQTLYEDLDPPKPREASEIPTPDAAREAGAGRPTKRERREIDAWHRQRP